MVRIIETNRIAVESTYGPDNRRTMLAIKMPRLSMSKAPISRMTKPAVMRRAPHGMRSVILQDLYLLCVTLVAACFHGSSSRPTMSARHGRHQMRSKLPQKLVEQSCLVDNTRRCPELCHRSQ